MLVPSMASSPEAVLIMDGGASFSSWAATRSGASEVVAWVGPLPAGGNTHCLKIIQPPTSDP